MYQALDSSCSDTELDDYRLDYAVRLADVITLWYTKENIYQVNKFAIALDSALLELKLANQDK